MCSSCVDLEFVNDCLLTPDPKILLLNANRKKQCIGGYGQFPFCLDEIGPEGGEPEVELTLSHTKDFNIHYGKLIPCGIEQEDKTIYGLKNKKDSDWEDYAVEIYQDKQPDSIFVGYRHYGA